VLYTALYMPATRTQIYLTAEQRTKLDSRRKRERKSLAAVVRDAIDAYVGKETPAEVRKVLEDTFGTNPRLRVPSRDEWREHGQRKRT
jgi:hypothetical protein